MKKTTFFILALCAMNLFSHKAWALVIGSGEILFSFGSLPPSSHVYVYGDGYYGQAGVTSPVSDLADGYLDENYHGVNTYLNNTIGGDWSSTGNTLSFSANAPGLDGWGYARVNFHGYMWWGEGSFPGLTYLYEFKGASDSDKDQISFTTSFEIRKWTPGQGYQVYYSDYIPPTPERPDFRSKQVLFYEQGPASINEQGFVTFDPISDSGYWQVVYDIVGDGHDFGAHPTDPIPEPTTFLLFGTGLAGLAAARRRKKDCC